MTIPELLNRRLHNQGLALPTRSSLPDTVRWLGAVQSQEFGDANWSLAARIEGLTQQAFTEAFNAGVIVRTHVLRPTWHFVVPADIRWMLALTAPRVKAFMRTNDRTLGLDEAVFSRSNRLIEEALAPGTHLTRAELGDVLNQAGIRLTANALAHVVLRAEVDGICCSGALRGRQHTYALLEQRVPPAKPLDREEALAELTERYFASHGPATAKDFSWWSGLTLTDARRGLALLASKLTSETIDGQTYWYVPGSIPAVAQPKALLLPNFDEYVVAYADRDLLFAPAYTGALRTQGNILFEKTVIIDGRIVGTWRGIRAKNTGPVWQPLQTLDEPEEALIRDSVRRYTEFYAPPLP